MLSSALVLNNGACPAILCSQLLQTLISCLLKFTFHGTRCASMQRGWISGCLSGTFKFYFILSQCILKWVWFFQNLRAINLTLSTEEMFFLPKVRFFEQFFFLIVFLSNVVNFLVPWTFYIISRWTRLQRGKNSSFQMLTYSIIPKIDLSKKSNKIWKLMQENIGSSYTCFVFSVSKKVFSFYSPILVLYLCFFILRWKPSFETYAANCFIRCLSLSPYHSFPTSWLSPLAPDSQVFLIPCSTPSSPRGGCKPSEP